MFTFINTAFNLVAVGLVWFAIFRTARGHDRPLLILVSTGIASWVVVAMLVERWLFQKGLNASLQTTRLTLALSVFGPVLIANLTYFRTRFGDVVRTIPIPMLVAPHLVRIVLGITIVAQGTRDRLPKGFANEAGIGDIAVGLLTVVVLLAYSTKWRYRNQLVVAWSVLGLLDLLNALRLGVFQVAPYFRSTGRAEIGLIPFLGVPILLISHAFVIYHLRTIRNRSQTVSALPMPRSSLSQTKV